MAESAGRAPGTRVTGAARRKLVVLTHAAEVERAEALLELAGAQSVSLRDAADVPLLEPEPGSTPLWPDVEIQALFDPAADTAGIAAWLEDMLGTAVRTGTVPEAANAIAEPVAAREIGRRVLIVPADAAIRARDRIAIRLRMGLAFGTGEHATTRMGLEWIERELEPGTRIVDYGCGSGVLAITALALGSARAWAVDIEPQALEATARNAELNGVAHRLRSCRPGEIDEDGFDVILANILAIPLIGLAGTFARLLAPGGRVVLTGILDAQADRVISAYESGFEALERSSNEGWSLVTARRKRSIESGLACSE